MKPIIGAHISASGGLYKAFENAKNIGADAMQIFGSSPQQWSVRLPKEEDVKKFKQGHKESGHIPVFLHASYLANLASVSEITRANALQSLTGHLKIADLISAQGLIFHIGSASAAKALATEAQVSAKEDAMNLVVEGCQKILKSVPGKTQLILENSSAAGAKLGATASEVGQILKKIKSERAKVCFDTAHAFASGYDLRNAHALKTTLADFDIIIGLKYLKLIHANDSKVELNAKRDRHEHIGLGKIGLSGFEAIVDFAKKNNIDLILETPDLESRQKDIEILKKIRDQK